MNLEGKTFYIATALENKDTAVKVMNALTELGMKVTYAWALVGAVEISEYSDVSAKELQGVCDAEIVIAILPGRFGTQTEVGAALATKRLLPSRRVIAYYETEEIFNVKKSAEFPNISIFWHHPFIERVVGVDPVNSIVAYLKQKA